MKNLEEATLKSIALDHFEFIPILEKYPIGYFMLYHPIQTLCGVLMEIQGVLLTYLG